MGDMPMAGEWIPRLKGHVELVQNLVKEVPRALDRPSLTFDQAARLHAVIEKGVRDFDDVLQTMDGADVDEQYREAAESLARTWQHLRNEAEDKVRSLSDPDAEEVLNDGVSAELKDNDQEDQADTDRKH
jgi:hypothetical protein